MKERSVSPWISPASKQLFEECKEEYSPGLYGRRSSGLTCHSYTAIGQIWKFQTRLMIVRWLSSLPGFSSWPQAKRRDVPGHSGATPSAQIHLCWLQTSAIFGLPACVRKCNRMTAQRETPWDVFSCLLDDCWRWKLLGSTRHGGALESTLRFWPELLNESAACSAHAILFQTIALNYLHKLRQVQYHQEIWSYRATIMGAALCQPFCYYVVHECLILHSRNCVQRVWFW